MLIDAARSAIRQTYNDLEIWIVDNCSTDNTQEAAQQLRSEDSRVNYHRHCSNIGMQANFNACLDMARGEFVIILCSDDLLEEGCVAALVDALVANPSAVFAAVGRTFVNRELEPIKTLRPYPQSRLCEGSFVILELVARGNFIGEPSAVMLRRRVPTRGFNVSYCQLLDFEMWLQLASQGPVILLPEPLCKIRQHGNQATLVNFRNGALIDEKKRLFRDALKPMAVSLPMWCKLRWDIRMVASISRVKVFGGHSKLDVPYGVFYQTFFELMLWFTNATWPITRARIKRTHRNQ